MSADRYNDTDMDALRRAMEILKRDPSRADQLTRMLADRPWGDVAEFAAGVCQRRALNLRPWEVPPACGGGQYASEETDALLNKMLTMGVSQWEPDPEGAMAKLKVRSK